MFAFLSDHRHPRHSSYTRLSFKKKKQAWSVLFVVVCSDLDSSDLITQPHHLDLVMSKDWWTLIFDLSRGSCSTSLLHFLRLWRESANMSKWWQSHFECTNQVFGRWWSIDCYPRSDGRYARTAHCYPNSKGNKRRQIRVVIMG